MPDCNSSKESWTNIRGDDNASNNLQFIADKYGVSIEDIKLIIERAGNNRKDTENDIDLGRHHTKR